jgi:hypothetical protein
MLNETNDVLVDRDALRSERPVPTNVESHLIDIYRQLSDEDQKQVQRLANLLAEHPVPFEGGDSPQPYYSK